MVNLSIKKQLIILSICSFVALSYMAMSVYRANSSMQKHVSDKILLNHLYDVTNGFTIKLTDLERIYYKLTSKKYSNANMEKDFLEINRNIQYIRDKIDFIKIRKFTYIEEHTIAKLQEATDVFDELFNQNLKKYLWSDSSEDLLAEVTKAIEDFKVTIISFGKTVSEQMVRVDMIAEKTRNGINMGLLVNYVGMLILIIPFTMLIVSSISRKINQLVDELKLLSHNISEGNFDKKLNEDKVFEVQFKTLVRNMNEVITKINQPLINIELFGNELNRGNLLVQIKGEYKGQFQRIQNNLNKAMRNLQQSISDIRSTVQIVEEMSGKIADNNKQVFACSKEQSEYIINIAELVKSLDSETSEAATANKQSSIIGELKANIGFLQNYVDKHSIALEQSYNNANLVSSQASRVKEMIKFFIVNPLDEMDNFCEVKQEEVA